MDRCRKHPPSPLYAKVLCWLGPLTALLLAFKIELGHMQEAFDNVSGQTIYEVETKVHTYELALEGFANFLAIAGDVDNKKIRAYIQGIRQLYPSLYMFEIARKVAYQHRDAFEQSMQAKGYRDFVIHGFDYDGDRQVTMIEARPFYYPIWFIEPELPAASNVLGLDLGSTSTLLVETLTKALKSPRPIASRPFELLEGGKGYVIYRPVSATSDPTNPAPLDQPLDFAMLAIKATDLLPRWLQSADSYSVSLTYKQAIPEPHTEILITADNNTTHHPLLEQIRFFQRVAIIDNQAQPFELTLTRFIHWSDFSLFWLMIVTCSGSLVSFYIARCLTQYHHRNILARQKQQRLYHQANFDPLTHLPNINLLLDRAEQAMRMADRANGRVGICYLDIDKFKAINDSLGHSAGDEALVEIAARLKKKLRDEDTAARIHGDEFVVLLPGIDSEQSLLLVSYKILSIFIQPLSIAGQQVKVGGSIGTALYPDDADNLESLLQTSDKRMYQHKARDKTLASATPKKPATKF